MKIEPILQEIEDVKDRLSEQAGDLTQFLAQMDERSKKHPHSGPVVNSPEELEMRVRNREATEKPLPPMKVYRVHDPIIAEIHRTRAKLYREKQKHSGNRVVNLQDESAETSYALREEPRKKNKNN
jgi:hypothetical protein